MGIFSSSKNNTSIKGMIGYYSLSEWWLSDFSKEEKDYIIKTYKPLGSDGNELIEGNVISIDQTVVRYLSVLSGWFQKADDRTIAYRILKKAEELIDESTNIIDISALYDAKIALYYKNRDKDPDALELALEACKRQIDIAPKIKEEELLLYRKLGITNPTLPHHRGFEQLAIYEEKQKRFESAIKISEQALEQGWAGDWEKRIERCKKKLNQ